jgi:hypothetical protein
MAGVTRDTVQRAIQAAKQEGKSRLRITFKKNSAIAVNFLLLLAEQGQFSLTPDDEPWLKVVASRCHWDNIGQRTTTITLTDNFREYCFSVNLALALEAIEVVE